jgi:poly(hydroxyalkanoate) depolymerase family esterase
MPLAMSCLLPGAPASAASLTGPISGWQKGTEPTWVSMFEYVPANLAPNPPILVLIHYCGGNAAGVLAEAQGGGIVAAADKDGFLMVVPQTAQNCWDVATKASLTHNGGGDTGAIVDMVRYSISKHAANANRVYAIGTSSGAMMSEGLLAVYPDVFKGGSEFAGVPAGCWSVNDPAGQWSAPCAGGQVTHTAAEWGTIVGNMYPGYSGFRPRVQLWHGLVDSIISYTNQTEAIKEWTNVLGLSGNGTSTSVTIGSHQYTHQQWHDTCGFTALDAWSEIGGPHGTDANLSATYTIPFFGLDKPGPTDPEVAQCMPDAGSTGGSGGSGGGGGSSATGAGGSNGESGAANGSGGSAGAGMETGSGTGTGTGGQGNAGDPSGNAGGESLDINGGSDAPGTLGASRPGCSCHLARASGVDEAFAWAGGLALLFGRRRRSKWFRRN